MEIKRLVLVLFLPVVLVAACTVPGRQDLTGAGADELTGVQALLWYQQAAETEALYLQGFNLAADRSREYVASEGRLPPAVILDIDETVLDNSPFNVDMVRKGYSYSEEKWADWCEMREALPLSGALEFTKLADSLGITVFYVSNRDEGLMEATLDNLQEFGFPNADEEHVLLKSTTSSKDVRRTIIREKYEVILLLGDNLGDFDGVFDSRTEHFGKVQVHEHKDLFGRKFIVFPNPIYGSWVKGSFPGGMPGEKQVLDQLRGYGH
ncbi:MAG: 5'-nucleotidase, lipoprotein e(P4) family [Bacteroidales bacterium]|nr:5'-nucleotidase, lipoprotein e(P4) family [Bacteroidales bacterium]MDT8430799.1 5'-nucleotidase, lipoprotein e(P4) family [Bacteroidales bacterium]